MVVVNKFWLLLIAIGCSITGSLVIVKLVIGHKEGLDWLMIFLPVIITVGFFVISKILYAIVFLIWLIWGPKG
jgi:hypothetical protein